MTSKLTLKLQTEVIELAKSVARKNKTSISKMVEAYFSSFKKPVRKKYIADELSGIVSEKKLRSYNDERINYILDKGKK